MGWLNGRGGRPDSEPGAQAPLLRPAEAAGPGRSGSDLSELTGELLARLVERIEPASAAAMPRGELAKRIKAALPELLGPRWAALNLLEQRDLVTQLINAILARAPKPEPRPAPPAATPPTAERRDARALQWPPASAAADPQPAGPQPADTQTGNTQTGDTQTGDTQTAATPAGGPQTGAPAVFAPVSGPCSPFKAKPAAAAPPPCAAERQPLSAGAKTRVGEAKRKVQPRLLDRIDATTAASMAREDLVREMTPIVAELLAEEKLQLNGQERAGLIEELLDDMLGLGPLEPLLADESITDIMVNGPKQIYVERKGKLELAEATFRDDAHVLQVATRIVTAVGRRVDESVPLVDARLADGSRVNIIIPPLAIDGPSISIRKFAKKKITLEVMARQANISPDMATVLRIAARARLNILISGGTGSGKTTLLNALSQMIDPGERVVTIEDAAELQLQQPHVVRLETRPANLEGRGEISMRDLVKNALRMRPDRIILGETRGAEAIDMLQAMNTGHDGSLSTIHANRPREALMRLENMVSMSGFKLPTSAVRALIASAIDVIVQISRMRDGVRRVTHISEVVGMEGDIITMQDLFTFEFTGEGSDGKLQGNFRSHGIRPHFAEKAGYFGLERALLEAV